MAHWLLASHFQIAPYETPTTHPPKVPFTLRQTGGVKCEPVWCRWMLVCSCLNWPWKQRAAEYERPCQAHGHAGGVMVHWGDGVGADTHRALTSVAPALQGPLLNTECPASPVMRWDASIWFKSKTTCIDSASLSFFFFFNFLTAAD